MQRLQHPGILGRTGSARGVPAGGGVPIHSQTSAMLTSRSGAVSQGRAQHAAQRSERSGEPLRMVYPRPAHADVLLRMSKSASRFQVVLQCVCTNAVLRPSDSSKVVYS